MGMYACDPAKEVEGSEEVNILLSIYSADRAQSAATIGTIGTVIVAGVGYIAVAMGVLLAPVDIDFGMWIILVPMPAWALFLFQLHLTSIMVARTQSILRLEDRFEAFGAYVSVPAFTLGQNCEERLTNLHVQPRTFWPGGILSFVLEPVLLVVLTVACLLWAGSAENYFFPGTVVGIIGYIGLFIASVIQFFEQARRLRDTADLLVPINEERTTDR